MATACPQAVNPIATQRRRVPSASQRRRVHPPTPRRRVSSASTRACRLHPNSESVDLCEYLSHDLSEGNPYLMQMFSSSRKVETAMLMTATPPPPPAKPEPTPNGAVETARAGGTLSSGVSIKG